MRSKLTPFVFAGVLTSALLGLAGGVQAATLVGNSISAEYDFPDLGTPLSVVYTPSTFTVGSGIETTLAISASQPTFDFSTDQLVITFVGGLGLNPGTFNGPVFTVLSGNPFPAIDTVSGILASDVFETGGKLALNWQSLSFTDGSQIVVTFAADTLATPLPAALPLFASGGALLGFLGWRRKRKNATTV